jgi:hypothetical protein
MNRRRSAPRTYTTPIDSRIPLLSVSRLLASRREAHSVHTLIVTGVAAIRTLPRIVAHA